MERIKNAIHEKYGLSNYQVAQLAFVCKSISSELSKIIIMSILFRNHLSILFFYYL